MSPWRDMVFSGKFAVVERLCGGEWRCRCRMTFQCIAKGRGKSRGRDRKIPGKIKHVITPLRRRRTTPRDYVRDGSTKETITVNTLCERTIWSYGTRLVVGRRISHILLPNASSPVAHYLRGEPIELRTLDLSPARSILSSSANFFRSTGRTSCACASLASSGMSLSSCLSL